MACYGGSEQKAVGRLPVPCFLASLLTRWSTPMPKFAPAPLITPSSFPLLSFLRSPPSPA